MTFAWLPAVPGANANRRAAVSQLLEAKYKVLKNGDKVCRKTSLAQQNYCRYLAAGLANIGR